MQQIQVSFIHLEMKVQCSWEKQHQNHYWQDVSYNAKNCMHNALGMHNTFICVNNYVLLSTGSKHNCLCMYIFIFITSITCLFV